MFRQINNCKLYCGNCLDVMPLLDKVDLILTDPPYGTTACKWDAVIPFKPLWYNLNRLTKPKRAIVMTASQPFTTELIHSNIKNYKYSWIWQKPQGVDPFQSKRRPLNDIEDVVVFASGRGGLIYNPQMTEGKPYKQTRDKKPRLFENNNKVMTQTTTVNFGTRYPTRVLQFKQEKGYHPTQKPVPLLEYLIRTYTNEGETVLDFTTGSGSTGVACVNTKRKFVGIEKNPFYFEIAYKRISEVLNGEKIQTAG